MHGTISRAGCRGSEAGALVASGRRLPPGGGASSARFMCVAGECSPGSIRQTRSARCTSAVTWRKVALSGVLTGALAEARGRSRSTDWRTFGSVIDYASAADW